jgi:hypothetical protein
LWRRAKNPRIKARLIPLGCLRYRHRRREIRTTRFRIRERLRIVCAPPPLTVFKFVAIMRQSARNGKRNTEVRADASARRSRFARAMALMFVIVNRR